jgi:homoserine dehydrogenase
MVDGEHFAMVAPKLVPNTRPLSGVSDAFNSISVVGNMLGESMFYGAGAGKLPTASAVIGDLVQAINSMNKNTGIIWNSEKLVLSSTDDFAQKVFVRMKDSVDKEKVAASFGEVEVVKAAGVEGEYAFITGILKEKELKEKAAEFEEILGYIRCA